MPQGVMDALNWIGKAGGFVGLLIPIVGFMFREKWKQILQRSLGESLERLKGELAKDVEAYRVSLIAQAEAAKAKEELKKSMALRYSEIEFERLVELERVLSPQPSSILGTATLPVGYRFAEQLEECMKQLNELGEAAQRIEMFLSLEDYSKLLTFRRKLLGVVMQNVGPNLPVLPNGSPVMLELPQLSIELQGMLRSRIKEIGKL